jgi:hypothetical protein
MKYFTGKPRNLTKEEIEEMQRIEDANTNKLTEEQKKNISWGEAKEFVFSSQPDTM